jgi:hypothetical protein
MTKTTVQEVDEALTLAYRIAHACPQQADARIWHQLIQLCPVGVVSKRALELQKDQRAERAEMRQAVQQAARRA